jgi:hypothetical protein
VMDVAEGGFSIREKGLSMLFISVALTTAYAMLHDVLHGTSDVVIARGKPGIAWMRGTMLAGASVFSHEVHVASSRSKLEPKELKLPKPQSVLPLLVSRSVRYA